MKLLLLKALLKRRARDEGFTLPMVIALGLVMILLGTTNIVKSSEENLNAAIQNSSSDALAIAEVGITKYRELLNQNRILTVYNHDDWNSTDVDGVDVKMQACHNMNQKPDGWTGTASRPKDSAADATDKNTTDNDNWWDVNNGSGKIGEYRLVSYIYDIDNNTANDDNNKFAQNDDEANLDDEFSFNDKPYPANSDGYNPKGILTVQGRSLDGSEAQIQVEIPIRINQQDMNNLAPALWLGNKAKSAWSSVKSDLGTLSIPTGDNVVFNVGIGTAGCLTPITYNGKTIVREPRSVPSIKSIKDTIDAAEDGISQTQTSFTNLLGRPAEEPYRKLTQAEIDSADGSETYKNDYCRDISKCRYYYNLGATTINQDTTVDGVAKTTLYVDGTLDIEKNIGSDISSSYLEIYVTDGNKVTVDTTNGDIEIGAFIHAPESQLEVIGGNKVTFRGSVWVDTFTNTSSTVVIEPDNTGSSSTASEKSYEHYTTTLSRTPRPLTASPTNWIKEEVQ